MMTRWSVVFTLVWLCATSPLAADDALPEHATVRFGTAKFRHGTAISSLAVCEQEAVAVATSGNHYLGSTRVYDLNTGEVLHSIKEQSFRVEAVAIAPDGQSFAFREDRSIVIRDLESGDPIKTIKLPALKGARTITRWMEYSPDGDWILVSSNGQQLDIFDVHSGKLVRTLPNKEAVFAVAFSPDKRLLATGGYTSKGNNYLASVWNTETGEELRRLRGAKGGFRALTFSPNGKSIAGGGDDGRLRIWEAASGKLLRTMPKDGRRIRSTRFSHDGKLVAAAGTSIKIYETQSGKLFRKIDRQATHLSFSTNDEILTAAVDSAISRWQVVDGEPLTLQKALYSAVSQIRTVDDTLITRDEAAQLHLWRRDGTHVRRLPLNGDNAFAVSRDRKWLVMSVTDETVKFKDEKKQNWTHTGERIKLLNLETGKLVGRFKGYAGAAAWIGFTEDDRQLITVDRRTARVRIWDFATGMQVRDFVALRDAEQQKDIYYPISGVAVSPSEATIAVSYNRFDRTTLMVGLVPVRLWNYSTGKETYQLDGHANGVVGMAFSHNGRWLGTTNQRGMGDSGMHLWETATGTLVPRFAGDAPGSRHVAFSPDGFTFATSSDDGTVRLWETATLSVRTEFHGHRDLVSVLHFADDGTLYSGGLDTTVLAWNVQPPPNSKGSIEEAFEKLDDPNAALVIAAQGRLLADPDNTVKIITDKVGPATKLNTDTIQGLIRQLDDRDFATREQATKTQLRFGRPIQSLPRHPKRPNHKRFNDALRRYKRN